MFVHMNLPLHYLRDCQISRRAVRYPSHFLVPLVWYADAGPEAVFRGAMYLM